MRAYYQRWAQNDSRTHPDVHKWRQRGCPPAAQGVAFGNDVDCVIVRSGDANHLPRRNQNAETAVPRTWRRWRDRPRTPFRWLARSSRPGSLWPRRGRDDPKSSAHRSGLVAPDQTGADSELDGGVYRIGRNLAPSWTSHAGRSNFRPCFTSYPSRRSPRKGGLWPTPASWRSSACASRGRPPWHARR